MAACGIPQGLTGHGGNSPCQNPFPRSDRFTRQNTALFTVAESLPRNIRFWQGPVKEGFLILSCMDRDDAFAIPHAWIEQNKKNLNVTERGDRSYWHVPVTTLETGKLAINMSKIQTKAPLEPYRFEFNKATKP